MSATASTFACGACGRKFSWTEQLAGKKVRCKCGQVIRVPGGKEPVSAIARPATPPAPAAPRAQPPAAQAPAPQAPARKPAAPASQPSASEVGLDSDDLYALVAEAESAAANQSGTIRSLAPAAPVLPVGPTVPPRVMTGTARPLGYRSGPTARDRSRADADSLLDLTRDVHVPLGMMAAGMLLYVGHYVARYNISALGITGLTFGLSIMTTIQAAILFGFAICIAGPLGVGFGDVRTAFMKFGATALLCDGVTIWAQYFTSRFTGGLNSMLLSWPAGLAVYWGAFAYLFSLDASEALFTVLVIRLLDFIVSLILITVLIGLFFGAVLGISTGRGGPTGFALPSIRSAPIAATPDPLADRVEALKGTNLLMEGRAYVIKGQETYMGGVVNNLYTDGAKHVWFEVTRDINMHATPLRVIVELPDRPSARARCFRDIKDFYRTNPQIFYDPASLVDSGHPYTTVSM